jgi:hypothetical protein
MALRLYVALVKNWHDEGMQLYLFKGKPKKHTQEDVFINYSTNNAISQIPRKWFPLVKFGDEPMEVKLCCASAHDKCEPYS